MKYTEDYRRLVGISGHKAGQGRLITGLEGYQGRNLIGKLPDNVYDQLALGFGGFDSIGTLYRSYYYLTGPWGERTTNDFEADSDAAAIDFFNKNILPGVPSTVNVTLIKVNPTAPTTGTEITEHYGTKGAEGPTPVAVAYQFVDINASGVIVETKPATYYSEQEAMTELERQVQFAPAGGRVELRAGSRVIASRASSKVAVTYQIYKNGTSFGAPINNTEDAAYAQLLAVQNSGLTTDTFKLVKVSTGEVVSQGPGKNVEQVSVQYWVSKRRVDESGRLVQEELSTISTSSLDAAKAHAETFKDKAYKGEEIVLRTKDADVYKWAGNVPVPPKPELEPDLGPTEPTFELPTELGASMTAGFEKFKTWATDQAVPPVPNGVWLGVGAAIIIGVGAAVATIKK